MRTKKRTVLSVCCATAMGCILVASQSALAVPPGPPGEVQQVDVINAVLPVEVTNPSVSVEVNNTAPIPVSVATQPADVRCGKSFLASVSGGTSTGFVTLAGASTIPSTVCPEMMIDALILDTATGDSRTSNVSQRRMRLSLSDPADPSGGEILLGVFTLDTSNATLLAPVHFTPGMRLNFDGQCNVANIGEAAKCAIGFTFIGRSIGNP